MLYLRLKSSLRSGSLTVNDAGSVIGSIALAPWLLTTQKPAQVTALALVCLDLLVNPLVTDTLALFIIKSTTICSGLHCSRIHASTYCQTDLQLVIMPHQRQIVELQGPVTLQNPVPAQLPADGRFVAFQHFGNLSLAIFGFLQKVN